MEKNKFQGRSSFYILAVLAMIGVIAWIAWIGWHCGENDGRYHLLAGLKFDTRNMASTAAGTVTGLIVVALIIERSMGVINAILFGEEQRRADHALGSEDMETRAGGEQQLRVVMQKKERLRLLLGFAVALFVSAAGVRCLQDLLHDTQASGQGPGQLFFAVDIIVTAGLIAGGSNGLAFLLTILKERVSPPDDSGTTDGNGTNGGGPGDGGAGDNPPEDGVRPKSVVPRRPRRRNPAALRARMVTTS